MITILLTCLLLTGETFVPPAEWTIDSIIGGGRPPIVSLQWNCTLAPCVEPRYETKIHLSRTLSIQGARGTLDIPKGCTLLSINGKE